jgi:hypothetical protein
MNKQERKRNEYLKQAADLKIAKLDLMRLQELEVEVKSMSYRLSIMEEKFSKQEADLNACYEAHKMDINGRVN